MTNLLYNLILNVDSYKLSHHNQYPPGTEYVYSYIESRGGAYDKVLFFGLQILLKDYFSKPITAGDIDIAESIITGHGFEFNRNGWEYILDKHNGYLPVEIRAVPEGTVVDGKNVLVTVVNTDPECYWLASYLETAILRSVWYPSTVATASWHSKQLIMKYLQETCDDPEGQIGFRLHDFGARGVSSQESAAIGGLAHIVNFMGTDTIAALIGAKMWYNEESVPAFSIPAMEHSTVTSWGPDGEIDSFRNMMNHYAKPGALLACVSDSYSFSNAVENIWGEELRKEVIDSGAILVIRPDSGDPVHVPIWAIEKLGEKFGYTVNSKGYKVLNTVRVIQGDGIDHTTISEILEILKEKGWSSEVIAFGMGGGLLQKVDRDTLKFAMKTSSICIDGTWKDVWKNPEGDKSKISKKGQLALVKLDDKWVTVPKDVPERDYLVPVFKDGKILKEYSFREVRENSSK